MTKSLFFALSCAVYFVGCMNAITEICKERNLIKREYMTTLSIGAYIISKTLLMIIVSFLQSAIFVGFFAVKVGLPEDVLLFDPLIEIMVITFLTSMAGAAMGMFVSSVNKNEDKASKLAPLLLMPQLLCSGVIFALDNPVLKAISNLTTVRWSMEAFGSIANLNVLDVITADGMRISRKAEEMFEFTKQHANNVIIILILFSIVFCVLSGICLMRIRQSDD
jgi:ABC-type multidrug transport system permease subunit